MKTLYITIIAIVFIMMNTGCSVSSRPDNLNVQDRAADQEVQNINLTLDDVFGEHNPWMFAGWGGMRTQQEWFLISMWSGYRMKLLDKSLAYFYGLYNRLPYDWNEIENSDFYPIRPINPFDGNSIVYDSPFESATDLNHVPIEASDDLWVLHYNRPMIPDGHWESLTWTASLSEDEVWFSTHKEESQKYPGKTALMGYMFANMLESLVWNYQTRRAKMPETREELLDGLWQVTESWAENLDDIDSFAPGGFLFGSDPERHYVVARWSDYEGVVYYDIWEWEVWETEGWTNVPGAGESHDNRWPVNTPNNSYVPPIILWQCMLPR